MVDPLFPSGDTPQHPAPPVDTRVRSTLAPLALIATLGLGLVAMMLHYLWVAMVPAVLLASWAMLRIDPRRAKGHGLALGALVLSLLLGSCNFVGSWALRDTARHLGTGVLKALKSGEADKVRLWVAKGAAEAGAVERLRELFAAVETKVGAAGGSVELGSAFLGGRSVTAAPRDLVAVVDPPEDQPALPEAPGTLWVRTRFGERTVWVALVLAGPDGDMQGLYDAAKAAMDGQTAAVLTDVRFFVES